MALNRCFAAKSTISVSNRTYNFTRADEELVDQKKDFEDSCQPQCVKPLLEYQACPKRIDGDDTGHKHCTGPIFRLLVAPKLFEKLK